MDNLEEYENQQGKYYNSIEDILHDMTQAEDVGLPWFYFIGIYENTFETFKISIDDKMPGISSLKLINIEYYNAVKEFEREVNKVFGDAMAPKLYNKLMALSLIMARVGEFVTGPKCNKELKSFNNSIMFLQKAKKRGKQPNEFYIAMSVIFLWEDLKIKYEYKKKDKRDKKKAEEEVKVWMDVLRSFFLKKSVEIVKMIYREREQVIIESIKIKDSFVYYHIKGEKKTAAYPLEFFDEDGKALTIILTGDKRSGKTIGSFKVIESALAQGYSIVIFGEDRRKEFRYSALPLDNSFPKLMEVLESQKQTPRGLPMKIYRKNPNPNYSIERDIKNFKGSPYQWNRINGVYLFEDDDKEIERVMRSFGKWRAKNKSKKVICVFNEAGEFIPSTIIKGKAGFIFFVKSWFTDIGGWKVPVILNTQYIKKIDKNARQVDTIITSYLSNMDDRKTIAEMSGDKRHAAFLGDQTLKPNNFFWMFKRNKAAKIKFLMTRCMPESSTDKTLDELFEESNLFGSNKAEKDEGDFFRERE